LKQVYIAWFTLPDDNAENRTVTLGVYEDPVQAYEESYKLLKDKGKGFKIKITSTVLYQYHGDPSKLDSTVNTDTSIKEL
jgi:hypothetical protein